MKKRKCDNKMEITRGKEMLKCLICGKKFLSWKCANRKFCSHSCAGRNRKGIKKIWKHPLISEAHPGWKGENVTKNPLHTWVKRRKIKPILCECCHEKEPKDLANISGLYKRDVNDFEWLCRSCHMHKDGRINNLIPFEKGHKK